MKYSVVQITVTTPYILVVAATPTEEDLKFIQQSNRTDDALERLFQGNRKVAAKVVTSYEED